MQHGSISLQRAAALFMPTEFPRIVFAGNSSQCIKRRPFKDTAAIQWPLDTCARRVWSSKLLRSVLSVLGLVTARNTGRILMQDAEYTRCAGSEKNSSMQHSE